MLRVLVVEDEEMIRKGIVLATDWQSLGCVVVGEASNGEEGIEKAEVSQPSACACCFCCADFRSASFLASAAFCSFSAKSASISATS